MKLLPAKIEGGKLIIEEQEVNDVILLSQGAADSTGQVIITDTHAIYIVNTQPDLQFAIDEMKAICDQLKAVGDSQYMISADKAVFGTPLASIASAAEGIKSKLDGFKLK